MAVLWRRRSSGRGHRRAAPAPALRTSAAGGRLARKHLGQLVRWQVLSRLGRIGGERAGSAGYVYALASPGNACRIRTSRYVPRGRLTELPAPCPGRQRALRQPPRAREARCRRARSPTTPSPPAGGATSGPVAHRAFSSLTPWLSSLGDFEDRYFVEIDCGTESARGSSAKAKTYVRYWQSGREQAETGVFPFVLWVAPDEHRAGLPDRCPGQPACRALAAVPGDHRGRGRRTRWPAGTSESISKRKEVSNEHTNH